MKETFAESIAFHLRACTPVMCINTDETIRVTEEIRKAAWKSGDGTEIKLSQEEFGEYKAIFDRYIKMPDRFLGKPNVIIYHSDVLLKCIDVAEQEMQKPGANVTSIERHIGRIEDLLNSVYTTISWDLVSGFSNGAGSSQNLETALHALSVYPPHAKIPNNCVVVMRDCHPFMDATSTPLYREVLRNLVEKNLLSSHGKSSHHIVFVQPDWVPHRDVQSCITVLDFFLPTEEQLSEEIDYTVESINTESKRVCSDDLRAELCKTMRGFTQTEASNALAYCVVKHGGFDPEMTKTIHRLQQATFSKGGVLTMADDDSLASTDQIGGFENYFEFIEECMLCYGPEARKANLARPKGCLLLGIPGSGKSVVAKATARKMRLPLLVYDFGAQFGSLVGQTESTQRQVLKQINAKGPCVVLLDEADKVFAGAVGGFQGDSGVNMRAFGRLLSWMANENEEAFVVMTMNRVLNIPPEMLRAGRLDAIFYTTFPTDRERLDILGIHMKKNGANPECLTAKQWCDVVNTTDQYVGSELEMIVKKAIRTAFKERRVLNPTFEEMKKAKEMITPVTKLDTANIEAIETFCKATATAVSKTEAESKVFKHTFSRNIKLNPSQN